MYILYLDESGAHQEAKHFILAGLAVFEREAHFLAQDVEAIQRRYFPDLAEPLEFHAAKLRAPIGSIPVPFDGLSSDQRRQLIADIFGVIREHRDILFGVAIEKAWCREDPYERAFEEVTNRFDLFLQRYNSQVATTGREEQRGLMVVAESSYRDRLQILGRRFRGGATRWRQVRTLADVPFFVPASNTRLLQLADFCANAIHGRYNGGYTRDFDIIAPKFDREGSRIHGLNHLCRDTECQCPACLSRQYARTLGEVI
ncbi:MAG: DUF3800 domain-containing protein [Planctomycetota bacterium]